MSKLYRFFAREKLLLRQNRELARLRDEVGRLRAQNDKINRAMRRCLTCDYRLDALATDDPAPANENDQENVHHGGTEAPRTEG